MNEFHIVPGSVDAVPPENETRPHRAVIPPTARRHVPGGRDYPLIRPVDQAARDRITAAVLEQIDPNLLEPAGGAR